MTNKKELILPCSIGDKIYILKEENCLWGHNPFEEGNACAICDEEECNYGYYIQERTVNGFYIDKFGVWIKTVCKAWNGQEEQIIKHSKGLGSEFFFNKEEAQKYADICNKNSSRRKPNNEKS